MSKCLVAFESDIETRTNDPTLLLLLLLLFWRRTWVTQFILSFLRTHTHAHTFFLNRKVTFVPHTVEWNNGHWWVEERGVRDESNCSICCANERGQGGGWVGGGGTCSWVGISDLFEGRRGISWEYQVSNEMLSFVVDFCLNSYL